MPLRSIEARRALRCVWVVVCAALPAAALALLVAAWRGRPAHAEPPRAPRAVHQAAPSERAPGSAPEKPPLPATRQLLWTVAGREVHVYPPLASAAPRKPAPVVLMLHGMCGDAQRACDYWSDAGREGSFLLCPAGNARCGEWDDWKGTGEEKAAALDEALSAADRAFPEDVTHVGGDILIGFSRGAFVARDVAYARPGRYRALVLMGASMTPDAAKLKASGVRRIVMAAGEYDGARPTMQRAARMLDQAGIPTRYMSLGRIGHAWPHDLEAILREALRWIREDGGGDRGGDRAG